MKRKILAAAMAVIMAMGSIWTVSAADTSEAEGTEENVDYDDNFSKIQMKEYSIRDEDVSIPAKTFFNQKGIDLAANSEASWRSCLSAFQQSVFDGICSELSAFSTDDIVYHEGYADYVVSVQTAVSGCFDSYDAETTGGLDDQSELTDIGWAILRDCPEYYWLKSYTLAGGIYYSSRSDITYVQFIFSA
ncbi:MAG: hypothetical protein LUG66_10180 [Clostridiales bacterium]|nr:hypothetical protein [Clostridiales bacterium]